MPVRYGRGGLLPMAVFLTQNSPGSADQSGEARLLGGAAGAGRDDSAAAAGGSGIAARRSEDRICRSATCWRKHRANPVCAGCHARFDSFGLAFEGYGPVGEARTKDLAGRPVDTTATFPGGSEGAGLRGRAELTSASIARRISWIISAANCSPTR